MTSDESKIVKRGSFDPGISDHKLVYSVLNLRRKRMSPQLKTVKNHKGMDVEAFRKTLVNTPWWISFVFDEVDDKLNAWELLYKNVVSEYVKIRKAKVRKDSLPWMTTALRKLLNERYKLLRIWQQDKNGVNHEKYKKARNLAKKEMRNAEVNYWKAEFAKATNSREFWKTVKRVQGKRLVKRIGPIADDQGNIHTDDKTKAELMNQYFSTIGEELASKLPENENDENSFVSRIVPCVEDLVIDVELLGKQLTKIKPEKATGPGDIKARDLNLAGDCLVESLKGLFGDFVQEKAFPKAWKKGKLKVAFKKGEQTSRGNYRPLTMLCIISKLFEQQICKPIDRHLTDHGLYSNRQWGYSEGRSTEKLLLLLTEKWKQALDEGKVVGVVFIDLRKAFDAINHKILSKKLQGVGICGNLYMIIENYLSDREQCTEINESASDRRKVTYGVPQGSVLGPKLFKIFVNDLPDRLENGELLMFADDTTAFSSVTMLRLSLRGLIKSQKSYTCGA